MSATTTNSPNPTGPILGSDAPDGKGEHDLIGGPFAVTESTPACSKLTLGVQGLQIIELYDVEPWASNHLHPTLAWPSVSCGGTTTVHCRGNQTVSRAGKMIRRSLCVRGDPEHTFKRGRGRCQRNVEGVQERD